MQVVCRGFETKRKALMDNYLGLNQRHARSVMFFADGTYPSHLRALIWIKRHSFKDRRIRMGRHRANPAVAVGHNDALFHEPNELDTPAH